jgi:hypothetical protein
VRRVTLPISAGGCAYSFGVTKLLPHPKQRQRLFVGTLCFTPPSIRIL